MILLTHKFTRAQADMEEAHATGAAQAGVAVSAAERGATGCASCLEEAWHWGFELDCWRAHLGPLTWPEILRQWAIAAGMHIVPCFARAVATTWRVMACEGR